MICPICKNEIEEDSKFCPICGKLIPRCPSCNKVITNEMRFCIYDGTPLPKEIFSAFANSQTANSIETSNQIKKEDTTTEKVPTKKKRWILPFLCILFFMGIIIFLGYFMLSGNSTLEIFSHNINSNPKKERKILTRVLERTFLPEFLNRIDTILHYSSITKEHILRIIDLEIAEIYNKNGHKIILDEDVQTHLCKAYNIKYGVRDIKRLFKNEILPLVAKEILANKQKSIIRLDNKHKFAVE